MTKSQVLGAVLVLAVLVGSAAWVVTSPISDDSSQDSETALSSQDAVRKSGGRSFSNSKADFRVIQDGDSSIAEAEQLSSDSAARSRVESDRDIHTNTADDGPGSSQEQLRSVVGEISSLVSSGNMRPALNLVLDWSRLKRPTREEATAFAVRLIEAAPTEWDGTLSTLHAGIHAAGRDGGIPDKNVEMLRDAVGEYEAEDDPVRANVKWGVALGIAEGLPQTSLVYSILYRPFQREWPTRWPEWNGMQEFHARYTVDSLFRADTVLAASEVTSMLSEPSDGEMAGRAWRGALGATVTRLEVSGFARANVAKIVHLVVTHPHAASLSAIDINRVREAVDALGITEAEAQIDSDALNEDQQERFQMMFSPR